MSLAAGIAPSTVAVKGLDLAINKERVAGGTILPGHLLVVNSSDQVVAHNVAGGDAQRAFAREKDIVGAGIGLAGTTNAGLNVQYVAGEQVQYSIFPRGSDVYALVAASAPAITKGDFLDHGGRFLCTGGYHCAEERDLRGCHHPQPAEQGEANSYRDCSGNTG